MLRAAPPPVFVFASTIAVYGSPLPERVDEDTPFNPQMTYGAQKLAGEFLVADFSRRGWVDGRSLRLRVCWRARARPRVSSWPS